ncbi:ATP-binding protein [Paucibacter sp. APW11]|uniref:histidine kinase n=1 Tax=Roseateles aquae TaxID=3077235 RepID=A0ABU3PF18_9BURK|nr:ATP-binding protein [Paucibacter sp. APW11]MDT9001151.1 ATP-binding protein [Paucibacter sp. APW11]
MSEAEASERRHGDRRRSDRRGAERRSRRASDDAQSWFGPNQWEAEWTAELPEAVAATATLDSEASQFFFRHARRLTQGDSGFQRLYRAFLAARLTLGLALVAAQIVSLVLGGHAPQWTLLLCMGYAAEATLLWVLPNWPPMRKRGDGQGRMRLSSPQWWACIGLDLTFFGLLHALDSSAGVSYGALFILPVMMAGVLTPRLSALATAALAALIMLGVVALNLWWGADAGLRMTQAGLAGTGFFVVSLLASELANRLAREERAARGSMELARQQAELNRLVIDEMQEGVLVVDRRGRVRAANPAARTLLADRQPVRSAPFQLRSAQAWGALVQAVDQAFAQGGWPEEGRDVQLSFEGGTQRSLRLRMRFTRRRDASTDEDLCVLFIEDNRTVQARSRQEKLAAMGRVSAGIAHEIRNPLAAIDQANALLGEDLNDSRSQQLTRMVASNVQRLKRIVDDVMEVAPGAVPEPVALDAAQLISETCTDWLSTNQLSPGGLLDCQLPAQPLMVSFEPEHLRRVLVNLLDNALRHAPRGLRTVQLRLAPQSDSWALLSVFSEGEVIPAEIEKHLFEPFFSTRSRGSGLGLYICRELCERYGGRIEYRSARERTPPGNEFRVLLPRVGSVRSPDPRSRPA